MQVNLINEKVFIKKLSLLLTVLVFFIAVLIPCESGIWTSLTWFGGLVLGSSQLLFLFL